MTGLPARATLLFAAAMLAAAQAQAAELKIIAPFGRAAHQTNEQIELAVVRSDTKPLAEGRLTLTLTGADGSRAACVFAVKGAALRGNEARATEHLRMNGWLLRPGRYTVEISADGASAQTEIEVYSHVRLSPFKLIDWGCRAKGAQQALLGERGLGFNLLYAAYGGFSYDDMIRGGADFMRNCTMGGGHQMDLRQECDWSDPYVLRGAAARVAAQALKDRVHPNCIGVHFYDEPGLTHHKHERTGVSCAYNIPSQDRSWRSAFDAEPPQYCDVKPDDPEAVRRWTDMNRWKLSFLEAAWKYARFAVEQVRPDFISCTQSVYGVSAYGDGYYFNVARSLPVISGHGGYSDWGPGYWHPSWTLEYGRARDLGKPVWYLPTWFNMSGNQFRLEQYLSFMTNVGGMAKPPDHVVHTPWKCQPAEGIVESNKLMAQLGTVFMHMPPDRGEVAVLHSLSQMLHAQVRDMQDPQTIGRSGYEGGGHSRWKSWMAWLAGRLINVPLFPVVEEDILDGTLAAHHRVLVIPGVDYLEPRVVTALERYIAAGGAVLVSDDSAVKIPGAKPVGCAIATDLPDRLAELRRQQKKQELAKLDTVGSYVEAAMPFARALKAALDALGIRPAVDADSPWIAIQRQSHGDVEYIFVVNASWDGEEGRRNSIKPAEAKVWMPADDRPVYDAVRGGPAGEFAQRGDRLEAQLRMGAGQMRVFARTAKQIGGVDVANAIVTRDYTARTEPVRVEISAAVVDTHQASLAGAIPLHIRVTDPLGAVRYDLFRAAEHGRLRLRLPLAANDPPGKWRVVVRELLNRTQGQITFDYRAPGECGAIAGMPHRAVYFGEDREHAFRFFRTHQNITIVAGSSEYNAAAARRLAEILRPWSIRCTIVAAADVGPAPITVEEARTHAGLGFGRVNPDKPKPEQVGFAVNGPAIVLGNPEDNHIIRFALVNGFLPYKPARDVFPGRGRGLLTWQRDAVSYGNESIMLIAWDAEGMSEAVGTLYEVCAGMEPLMPLEPPLTATISPATQPGHRAPEARVSWRTLLPDRAVALESADNGNLTVTAADGSVLTIDRAGKAAVVKTGRGPSAIPLPPEPRVPPALAGSLMPHRIVKYVAARGDHTAVGYWGGTVEVLAPDGAVKTSTYLHHDINGMAWLSDRLLAVALSDGTVVALVAR